MAAEPKQLAPAQRPLPSVPAGPGQLPNLLVIGAQKAGTTWLHNRLAEHPRILMSRRKELNLFADRRYEVRLDEYRAHFPPTQGKAFYGESTPGYFWTYDTASPYCAAYTHGNRDIPGSVLRTLGPETRLVLSLRHPVERAISAFFHHFCRGRLGPEARLSSVGAAFGIIDMGFYARHHAAWAARFGEDGLITVLFDQIAREPRAVLERIYAQLGLDLPGTSPDLRADHTGFRLRLRGELLEVDPGVEENRTLLERWGRTVGEAPKVHTEDISLLLSLYGDDILFCQRRFGDAARVDWVGRRNPGDFLSVAPNSISAIRD